MQSRMFDLFSRGFDEICGAIYGSFSLIPLTFSFICDTTSGVHIEKIVFSNGFTLPISSSDTVRPRPV